MEKILPEKPVLIMMYGFPGSGKTYFARQFCEEVQMAHLDYAGAVDRYKAARDWADRPGNPIDMMELSVIDTRLHQAEQLLREQQQDDR